MPQFQKINDVLVRMGRARSVATALKLAAQARHEDIYWPDLMSTLESMLPTHDELGAALDDIYAAEQADTAQRPATAA